MGAAHKIGHAAYHGPSVVKEILYGITLGLIAGGLWKMHHWKVQRQTREFYDMLEKEHTGTIDFKTPRVQSIFGENLLRTAIQGTFKRMPLFGISLAVLFRKCYG